MSELGSTVQKKKKQSPSLKARALRLLSMREYSRKGLAAKLEESAARMFKHKTAEEDFEETAHEQQQETVQANWPFPQGGVDSMGTPVVQFLEPQRLAA